MRREFDIPAPVDTTDVGPLECRRRWRTGGDEQRRNQKYGVTEESGGLKHGWHLTQEKISQD
jgi:hypothetical protein